MIKLFKKPFRYARAHCSSASLTIIFISIYLWAVCVKRLAVKKAIILLIFMPFLVCRLSFFRLLKRKKKKATVHATQNEHLSISDNNIFFLFIFEVFVLSNNW